MALTEEPAGAQAEGEEDSRDQVGEGEPEAGLMTLGEHLSELRRRLIICILAVAASGVVAWFFYDQILHFMVAPYVSYYHHHHNKSISSGQLITNGPLEGLTTRLKISTYIGLAAACPVWVWELWRFITPGLHKNEKKYAVPFVISAVALFALGVTTAILVFPKAIGWLVSVSGSSVSPLFSASAYFNMYVVMCLAFGVVFLYPIVMMFLILAGVVPTTRWRRWRRFAIVVIAAVAAVITPSSDPFSFVAMGIPMYIFYEACIVIGRILKK